VRHSTTQIFSPLAAPLSELLAASPPVKILNIIQCTNLGGMEKVALLSMVGLNERGHNCRLISLNPLANLESLLVNNHIPALGLSYQGRYGWRSLAKMYRAFRSAPADGVIVTGQNFAAMVALGNLCKERRLLCMHHYDTSARPKWQWKLIYRLAIRKFQAITYPADFIRREAEEIYPPIAAISHTVRNPLLIPNVPSDEQRIDARARLSLPQSAKIVGSAGWLIERKRIDIFLRVAQEIARVVPEALFVIAGDGPLRSNLVELAQTLGIKDRIRWLGWQSNLEPFYAALDVLHFNSDRESLGMTPLEAIAHGVPVVASVVHGGLGEAVEPERHVFLTRAHDIDWLTEKVLFVLKYPEISRKMASVAREHLAQTMSIEQHVTEISRLLRLNE